MEHWVYVTGNYKKYEIIINKEGEYETFITKTTGELWLAVKNTNPGWNWVKTGYNIPKNKWTHIAVTYSSSVGKIIVYVNGE